MFVFNQCFLPIAFDFDPAEGPPVIVFWDTTIPFSLTVSVVTPFSVTFSVVTVFPLTILVEVETFRVKLPPPPPEAKLLEVKAKPPFEKNGSLNPPALKNGTI